MRVTAAVALLGALAPALVHAQAYPTAKPITVIMPVASGVAHDQEVRAWTDLLSASLGQTIIRENKPGGGTIPASLDVARAKPDGYTLGTATINLALIPLRYDDAPVDPVKSFEQISVLNKRPTSVLVSSQLPIHNVKEYIAYARAHPGELNFATAGEGSIDHITGLWLMADTGTQVTFIHYKSSGLQQADQLAGRVHVATISMSVGGTYGAVMASGKVRNIGVAALERSPIAPDVPTFDEQGVKGFEVPSFVGFQAPAKTPAAIINRLHDEVVKVAKNPELQKKLGPSSIIVASTPAEYRTMLQGYTDRYRKLATDYKINMKGGD